MFRKSAYRPSAFALRRAIKLAAYGPSTLLNISRTPKSAPPTWTICEVYGAYYGLPLLCTVRVEWDHLLVQLHQGPTTAVDHTPHLAFVKAYAVENRRDEAYINYLDRQYRAAKVDIESMVTSFEAMIDEFKASPREFRLLTRASPGGNLTVLDGAHRAALMRALGGSKDVECAVCTD